MTTYSQPIRISAIDEHREAMGYKQFLSIYAELSHSDFQIIYCMTCLGSRRTR